MIASHALILVVAGLVSGLMNSVAGGGSFVAFPVLVFLGLLPIEANATATFAVFPGTVSTLFIYRKELLKHKEKLPFYISLSTIGGAVGALLLINISNAIFSNIVPYLLLIATLLFTFRGSLIPFPTINFTLCHIERSEISAFFKLKWILHFVQNDNVKLIVGNSLTGSINKITSQNMVGSKNSTYRAVMILLFIAISIYGGFFGAGMGILLLALFSLMGMHNIHEMNSLRSCTGLFANIVAILLFGMSGIINWQYAAMMAIGCILGGYCGAHYALKMPPERSRIAVIIIGWSMTVYFFWKNV